MSYGTMAHYELIWDCSRSFPPLFVAGQAELVEFIWVPLSCECRAHHRDSIAFQDGRCIGSSGKGKLEVWRRGPAYSSTYQVDTWWYLVKVWAMGARSQFSDVFCRIEDVNLDSTERRPRRKPIVVHSRHCGLSWRKIRLLDVCWEDTHGQSWVIPVSPTWRVAFQAHFRCN